MDRRRRDSDIALKEIREAISAEVREEMLDVTRTWRVRQFVLYGIMAVLVVALAFFASANRRLIQQIDETSARTDQEIMQSRLKSVEQTCLQFNDVQDILADLVRVALNVPPHPGITETVHERGARSAFKRDLHRLRRNDCDTQRALLQWHLLQGDFSAAVPYSPNP